MPVNAQSRASAAKARSAAAKQDAGRKYDAGTDPGVQQAQLSYAALIALAREDSALFCELVLRDEETGDVIENTPMHEEWHRQANTGKHMVIWCYPEGGKSQQMAIGRVLWLLGRNPRYRIAILAAAERQAKKLIDSLRKHIESNEVLHAIFPNLRKGDMWQDNAFSVRRPGAIIKDPSVQAISPTGKLQGARLDLLIIDDILVEDNTRTAHQREKTTTWVRASAFSRLSRKAQIIVLANAFHPEDMAHVLAREGFWAKKYPVVLPDGTSADPVRYPMSRIDKKREELGPKEFARMYMCEPRSEGDSRFREEWFEKCKARGEGYQLVENLKAFVEMVGDTYWKEAGVDWDFAGFNFRKFPAGFRTCTGVDLGVSRQDAADPTVVFTGIAWPDGTRQPLNVAAGRWPAPTIMDKVVKAHKNFHAIVIVEDNAAQDFLLQWLRQDYPDIPVVGFRTGKNKKSAAYGVESIGTELADEKWLIPSRLGVNQRGETVLKVDQQLALWIQEALYYTPDGHTGDRLMASWFMREGFRAFHRPDGGGEHVNVHVIG